MLQVLDKGPTFSFSTGPYKLCDLLIRMCGAEVGGRVDQVGVVGGRRPGGPVGKAGICRIRIQLEPCELRLVLEV